MREKIRKWAPPIITIAITVFIFSMSARPASQSDEISLETTKTAVGIWTFLLPFFHGSEETVQQLALVLNPLMRKVAHFVEFATLGVSAFMTTRASMPIKRIKTNAGAALGYSVLIACMDETLQLFIEGRHGSIWDILLDSAGATAGILFMILIKRIVNRKQYPNRKV